MESSIGLFIRISEEDDDTDDDVTPAYILRKRLRRDISNVLDMTNNR